MPVFYGDDETPDEDEDEDELENLEMLTTTTHRTRTLASNADINTAVSSNATVEVKPYITGEAASSRAELEDSSEVDESKETHECPVCEKTLETDNKGLNSHIDFCLSRGAIWKAQAEARSPALKHKPTSWQWGNLKKGQGEKLDSTRNTGKRKAME
ncbi:hypothetical protein K443DRAFT_306573 [Laccaria amethystina LaAM-08-1]|uniref:UBZ4-type domain-containing protein n=1 Tax=Laccaria amethystina LaAM-08-1 TaxID=1095629 RepID=A0A0C9YI58_9AGAR|nr:hypothetical protein K443DRAFT_306573 [Laccaria amethystina LaAM-08-1]